MLIESLRLTNFRCFKRITLPFSDGLNWIYGPNATGKTSVLEAIFYCISGRSFRSSRPFELIRQEEEAFHINLLFTKHTVSQNLSVSISEEKKRIKLNASSYPSFSSLLGALQGVAFTGEDLNLIKGGPTYRRLFLDIQLAQVDPLYVYHLARYTRALKQRNALLKIRSENSIEIWEKHLADSASYLILKRSNLIKKLEVLAQKKLNLLSPSNDQLTLIYRPSYPEDKPDSIMEHLKKQRKRDLDKQLSQTGTHRDDILFYLNGKDLRYFSSEGQKLSAVAALKLAEWSELKESSGDEPIFLVDDIGSCLDEDRTSRFLQILEGMKQCFISSPSANLNLNKCHFIPMESAIS